MASDTVTSTLKNAWSTRDQSKQQSRMKTLAFSLRSFSIFRQQLGHFILLVLASAVISLSLLSSESIAENCPYGGVYDGANCLVLKPEGNLSLLGVDGQNVDYRGTDEGSGCLRQVPPFTVQYDGANCWLHPPAGTKPFLHNKSLYLEAVQNMCPHGGTFDSANCLIMMDPPDANFFQIGDKFYYTAVPGNPCPHTIPPFQVSFDGANCHLAPPGGTKPFIWDRKLYLEPACRSCTTPCPQGGGYDGANCFVSEDLPDADFFSHAGSVYYTKVLTAATCPHQPLSFAVSYDGANCYLQHTAGGKPFIHAGNLYLERDPRPANNPCPHGGTFDGANCLVMDNPAGAEFFAQGGNFYYTYIWNVSCTYRVPGWALNQKKNICTLTAPTGAKPFIHNAALYVEAFNQAPSAEAGGPYIVPYGNAVQFTSAGSQDNDGTIVSYLWNFGDLSTGEGETISHVYSRPGQYLATLTVTDNKGAKAEDSAQVAIFEAYSRVDVFNCHSNRNPLQMWVIDLTNQTRTNPGELQYQGASGSACPLPSARPFSTSLTDGHLYEIVAVDYLACGQNDPTITTCRRWEVRLLGSSASVPFFGNVP